MRNRMENDMSKTLLRKYKKGDKLPLIPATNEGESNAIFKVDVELYEDEMNIFLYPQKPLKEGEYMVYMESLDDLPEWSKILRVYHYPIGEQLKMGEDNVRR